MDKRYISALRADVFAKFKRPKTFAKMCNKSISKIYTDIKKGLIKTVRIDGILFIDKTISENELYQYK